MRRVVLVAVAASLALSACATTHTVGRSAAQTSYVAHPGTSVDGTAQNLAVTQEQLDMYEADVEVWRSPLEPPTPPARLSAVQATPVRCPGRRDLETPRQEEGRSRLDAGVSVAAVVLCGYDEWRRAGNGVWNFTVAQRATTGLGPILRALRHNDEPRSKGGLCSMDWVQFPWIAVVTTDGRVLRPRVPETSCGRTRGAFDHALWRLDWVRYDSAPEKRIVSEARLMRDRDAYMPCLSSLPDRLAAAPLREPLAGRFIPALPGPSDNVAMLCAYTVGRGAASDRMVMARQIWMDDVQQRAIADAMRGTTDVRPCARLHTDVVSVYDRRGRWILVERDGCRRVLAQNGLAGQASDELLRAIGVRL
jgi:hypothetical protein